MGRGLGRLLAKGVNPLVVDGCPLRYFRLWTTTQTD
jgi:hypothetical protein